MTAAFVIGAPVAVAALFSLLGDFDDCPPSSRAEGLIILICSALMPGAVFLFYIKWEKSWSSAFAYPAFYALLPFGLGIWGSIQPERQVLVNGHLIITPPLLTFSVVSIKYGLLPG